MEITESNEHSYWFEGSDGDFNNEAAKTQTRHTIAPNDQNGLSSSQLFTVRIWPEITAQGPITWRGKIQHVPNGAWRYFHDWHGLNTFLQSQVEEFANTVQRAHDTQPNP